MCGGNRYMAGVINVFCGKHSGLDISAGQFFGTVGQGEESGVIWECSGEESDNFGRGERSFLLGHNGGYEPAMSRLSHGPKPPGGLFKLGIEVAANY